MSRLLEAAARKAEKAIALATKRKREPRNPAEKPRSVNPLYKGTPSC